MLRKETVLIAAVQLVRFGSVRRAVEPSAVWSTGAGVVVAMRRPLHPWSVQIVLPQVYNQSSVGTFWIGGVANGTATSGRGPVIVPTRRACVSRGSKKGRREEARLTRDGNSAMKTGSLVLHSARVRSNIYARSSWSDATCTR